MRKLVSAAFAALICTGMAHASLFSQFVIFGDSLSDNGNAFIGTGGATPAPPAYTVGRFTDGADTFPASPTAGVPGLIWNEVLAGMLGVPVATPFIAGGTNYAVGGAQVLQDVPGPGSLVIPSLQSQLGLYLTSTGGLANPNALYVLWGGANDLYSAVETPGETAAQVAATETAMAGTLAGEIGVLAGDGAKNFLWLNLPQLASTPRAAADGLNSTLNTALANASTQFSTDIATDTAALEQSLGVKIADVDVYGLFQKIMINPSAFGYTNVTTPAQGLAGVNPDQYLFWDVPGHPTTTGHVLIAQAADAAINSTFAPEPASWTAAGIGLLMLAWVGIRRKISSRVPAGGR